MCVCVLVIFRLLDENQDGHLDVSELLCAVSIWCNKDLSLTHKCTLLKQAMHAMEQLLHMVCT